jgi:hypothetical protein
VVTGSDERRVVGVDRVAVSGEPLDAAGQFHGPGDGADAPARRSKLCRSWLGARPGRGEQGVDLVVNACPGAGGWEPAAGSPRRVARGGDRGLAVDDGLQ